jgi:hypothetical protein
MMPDIEAVFVRVQQGDRVTFPQNNVEKCGNVISCASERARAVEAALSAIRRIDIRLEPGDPSTIGYLFGEDSSVGKQEADSRDFYPLLRSATRDLVSLVSESRNTVTMLQPDYSGRTLSDTLSFLELHPGFDRVARTRAGSTARRRLTVSVIKGGLQGGRFFLDTINSVREFRERILRE